MDEDGKERPHLRIVRDGEAPLHGEQADSVPDLGVFDPDFAVSLRKNGFAAVVDIKIPEGTTPHEVLRDLALEKLHGRIPSYRIEQGFIRISFALENHNDDTTRIVDEFATKFGALIGSPFVDYQFFMVNSRPEPQF